MTTSTLASTNSSASLDLRRLSLEQKRELLALLEKRAALDAIRREPFADFIPRVSPGRVRPDHLGPVLDLFERIRRGERVRACVSIPSQHGKTELVLHALAWILAAHPTWPLIYLTYQQEQSDDKSHGARAIAQRAGIALAPDRANLGMWRTPQGGGCVFTSVGGPGAGQPAQVAIVDDPYKNMAAAMSPAIRKAVKSTFSSVVLQRGQEGMSVVVVHTRWLEDDLIGDLEKGEFGSDWEIVNLPMLALDDGSPAPRPYTTATRVLNPARMMPDGRTFGWTLQGAIKQLQELPEPDAESMGQGKPRRRVDGALWSWDSITAGRVAAAPSLSRIIVVLDPNAASETTAAACDDAGIVVLGKGFDGRAYILEDASGNMSVQAWARKAIYLKRKWSAACIVAERNLGGPMIAQTIRAVTLEEAQASGRPPEHIEVELVAVRGEKVQRSSAARQLYPHMVSHVGVHARLENTMTSHDYSTSKRSPGDLDALSLGLSTLVLVPPPPARLATEENYDF